MKYLESVKLVQFFLFEKQDIRLEEITGIFGPNGSGKSSLVDAVQICMFGGNQRLANLNAQADERATTRTIRSYCLGVHDETKRARDSATTYITMIWRDTVTKVPLTMGVCLYASADTEGHEVRGRYILPGVELAMQDHLELVDNEERPRTWEAFRHQLIDRSKVSGEDPLYTDSERYIKAALHALRGSGSVPAFEAFKSAFKFALRMKFDKSVDHIVRQDVLEARPTNVLKFKEVTESFRKLAQMVAEVKAKIKDGEKAEAEFAKAAAASRRATTWAGLYAIAHREECVVTMSRAVQSRQGAEQELESLNAELAKISGQLQQAQDEERLTRELRINHAAHKEHGALQGDISKANETEAKKASEIRSMVNMTVRALGDAAKSMHLQDGAANVEAALEMLKPVALAPDKTGRVQLLAALKPALKVAERAASGLFKASLAISGSLTEAEKSLTQCENAMRRVKDGRSRLTAETEALLAELRDNGLHPTPICDLVTVTDPEWQPIIEACLGRNVEALLVEKNEEERAFAIYRGMTGPRAIFGAKIVAASKQELASPAPGTVAELIEGSHLAAVAYLRRRFGDMTRAATNTEAMAGQRTLTKDGMIAQWGEYERRKPLAKALLKIGGGDDSHKALLAEEIRHWQKKVDELTAQRDEVKTLYATLQNIANESNVLNFMLGAWDEMHAARTTVESLTQRLLDTADAEYVRLGERERELTIKVQQLQPEVGRLQRDEGRATTKLEQCAVDEAKESERWKRAEEAADTAVQHTEYDRDYASVQWDDLLSRYGDQYLAMAEYCTQKKADAEKSMHGAISRGSGELGTFKEKYREQGAVSADDWRGEREWINSLLQRLRDTELSNFERQMNDAYKTSQETFRADVAIALSNNIDHLNSSMNRLNQVLNTCPVFSNGERYQFKRTVRPQLERLYKFVKDIAAHGPGEDLFGGAGEIPEEFRQLLDEKVAPGAAGIASPLDDYREFFEFDISIFREDSLTKQSFPVGSLSKRLGTGSGGEHRAPLYVIAGAALASAYRLDSGNKDGIRLILLDEAFNKMDAGNIVATMRYLEQLGLQIFMASPGENLGTLTAFLHRYYDILRDVDNSAMLIQGHDISEGDRELLRSDLPEFNPDLVAQELSEIRGSRMSAVARTAA